MIFATLKNSGNFIHYSVKLKSDKSDTNSITITKNNETFNDPEEIGKLFNTHFTTLASDSKIDKETGAIFIENIFEDIKKRKIT